MTRWTRLWSRCLLCSQIVANSALSPQPSEPSRVLEQPGERCSFIHILIFGVVNYTARAGNFPKFISRKGEAFSRSSPAMREFYYFCKMAVTGPVGEPGGDICCSLNKMLNGTKASDAAASWLRNQCQLPCQGDLEIVHLWLHNVSSSWRGDRPIHILVSLSIMDSNFP